MELAAILLTVIVYGLAGYLWWQQRSPIYLFALLSGHLSALASPLWRLLYGVTYSSGLDTIQAILGQPIPQTVLIAAAWYYPLPALVVLFLYQTRWWFPGLITGLLTFLVFLLYHLLIETLGLRNSLWSYRGLALPLGLSSPIFSALMSGLVSYGLLYVLLAVYRYAWLSMALAMLPAALVLSLGVHGLLGAPLWVALLLQGAPWMVTIGMLSAIALLLWAVSIITGGIRRLE